MAKTIDRVADMRPYVERAIRDEEVRENVRSAFAAARDVYYELMGPRGVSGKAMRVASDQEIRDSLRSAIEDLRAAADRIQKRPSHKARNALLVGIALGILFYNPMTGADTRKWVKDTVLGSEDEFGYQGNSGGSQAA
jgi:hypothetical protein